MTTSLVANIARPISSALSTAFNSDNVGLLAAYGKLGVSNPDAVIEALFAASEQGAWYDPSDLSTMFQDSAGTTPVTAAGQPVGKILDKSGRNNHASQATAAKRPLLQNDGVNNYLAFDGVDDSLATAAIDFTSTDKMSVFSGVRKADDTVRIVFELSPAVTSNPGSFYLVTGTDSGFNAYSSLSRGAGAAGPSVTAGTQVQTGVDSAVIATFHDIAGDLSTIRRNTVAGTNGVGDKGSGNFGNYPLFIGARYQTSLFLNGRLYSAIVLGRLATTQEITDTETWVNSKTGAY